MHNAHVHWPDTVTMLSYRVGKKSHSDEITLDSLDRYIRVSPNPTIYL